MTEADHSPKLTDRQLMELAVQLCKKCTGERPNSPKVAALVEKDGQVLGRAFRGELKQGEHAEFTLLERMLPNESLAGATLYTTLEPCTSRNSPKIPCAQRIVERKIKRVVIGILDRNPLIQGNGLWQLRDAGIQVTHFDPDLTEQIEEMNREFLRPFRASGKIERTQAETTEPVNETELGPNGFKLGYNKKGDKVEWIEEEDGETWEMILRRNDNDILKEYNELWDKVWWNRHQHLMSRIENGEHIHMPQAGIEAAKRIEEKYGIDDLIFDDVDWGIIQGKMSALSWVMGSEW